MKEAIQEPSHFSKHRKQVLPLIIKQCAFLSGADSGTFCALVDYTPTAWAFLSAGVINCVFVLAKSAQCLF